MAGILALYHKIIGVYLLTFTNIYDTIYPLSE
jgi:hypothetical protein